MKQTKKLTRNQKEFLEAGGIENIENLRVCYENTKELVCYDVEKRVILEFKK